MGHPADEPVNVPESLEKIEDLQLIVVESGDSDLMRIHNELICSEHPLGDKRLTPRLVKIAGNKSRNPGASYLEAAHGDRYDIKAYYKFIRSERVTINFNAILWSHAERTRQRMKSNDCVLVIQDTTEWNFSNLKCCEGLGTTGESQNGFDVMALKVHSSFFVDGQGLPLGILGAKFYAPVYSKI